MGPATTAGMDSVNKAYAGANDATSSALAGRGFGNSGTLGTELQGNSLAEAGAKGSLEANLQNTAVQEQDKTMQEAQQFAFSTPGGTNNNTSVSAGSAFASALAAGLQASSDSVNQVMPAFGAAASAP